MQPKDHLSIIKRLFDYSEYVRYVAVYTDDSLTFQQREDELDGSSSSETDRYEELLVNPTLLKLATQRGNIDCGGLDFLVIGYGNFYQLVKGIPNGHLSVCIDKQADLNTLPQHLFNEILK